MNRRTTGRSPIKGVAEADERSDSSEVFDHARNLANEHSKFEELFASQYKVQASELEIAVKDLQAQLHSMELEMQKVTIDLHSSQRDLDATLEYSKQVESLQHQIQELTLTNHELTFKVQEMNRNRTINFWLILFATLFIGIGVNLITGNIQNVLGWAILICGIALEIVAFLIKPKSEGKAND